ncbi:hypothetical protein GQ457_18G023660 [Hibiscus cannabinus]
MPLAFPLLIPADCPVVLILGILVFCCLSHTESDASDHPYKEVKPLQAYPIPCNDSHAGLKRMISLSETGWKYIHGDIFRFRKYKSLFAAAAGSGTQLFTLMVFIFMLALVTVFYPYNRGALFTALLVIYALTSRIAGPCSLHSASLTRLLFHTVQLPHYLSERS